MRIGEQKFRRVLNLPKTGLNHLIYTKLGCRAKPVFDTSKNSVHIMLVALELDNSVNDVFKNLWTCDASLLVYMTNQYNRNATRFGKTKQGCSTFANLNNASRAACNLVGSYCLYGVDNNKFWLHFPNMIEYLFERRFR